MIGKAKSITHVGAAIDYVVKREKAEMLVKEKVIGDTGAEIAGEFRIFQQGNEQCKNNSLSVVLSPAIEDGKRLDNAGLRAITRQYVEKMGLKQHQYAAFVHRDKAHAHVHLFVNRIDLRGNAANDSFIGKRSQRIADEIAQERQLVRAREVGERKQALLSPLKAQVREIHRRVLESRPVSLPGYVAAMQGQGVAVRETINKQGERQGYRIEAQGVSLKASQVGKEMSLKRLEPLFAQNAERKQQISRGRDRGQGMER